MGRQQIRYGTILEGEFGYHNSWPGVWVGNRFFPVDMRGKREVLGQNGSTRFKPLEKRPGWGEWPGTGARCAGEVCPPYSGRRKELGPRMGQWGERKPAVAALLSDHGNPGGRRARRRFYRQRQMVRVSA